jgi:hypothetical protein
MTYNHVDFIAIGGAEVSHDCHKVFKVFVKSSMSPLALAFVVSTVDSELNIPSMLGGLGLRTESQT